ncbi:MAG: SIS domain-containing protein [Parachlamydiales bacterium]
MIFKRLQEFYHTVEKGRYTQGKETEALLEPLEGLFLFAAFLQKTLRAEGKVFVIGNGGSAGIASHFATDLLKALKIPALTLFDSNIMTCLSNDYGYEHVFSEPLKRLLKKEDLLVAISSSGKSPNILKAAQAALDQKASLITLSGFRFDNPLRFLGGLNIWLEAEDYGLVETGHFFILHTIVDLWKTGFFAKASKKVSKGQLAYVK